MIERDLLFLAHILDAAADIDSFIVEGRAMVEHDLPTLRENVLRIQREAS